VKLRPDEIQIGLDFHYRRKVGARVDKGRCEVKERRFVPGAGGGWFFTVQDTKTLKVHKLRTAHFVRRVLVR
jgi:hypothetical protein